MAEKNFNEHYDPVFDEKIVIDGSTPEGKAFLEDLENPPEPNEHLKELMSGYAEKLKGLNPRSVWDCYQMIADEKELKWFFDHVVMKPQVNESYSAVFVSRHKKLTKEEQETIGLTRKESEFLATQSFRLAKFKDAFNLDEENNWSFESFLKRIRRFNVDKYAYTTALGEPIPTKTLAIIFYVNPCDDIKVADALVEQINSVKTAICKAMLGGKTTSNNLQSYQMFGNLENNLKHFKANQKGTRYWLDFDIDVPKWFKAGTLYPKDGYKPDNGFDCYQDMKSQLNGFFGKGNYIIIDTTGGYHVLVKTNAIKSNPHDFCKHVELIYKATVDRGYEPYLDENGNEKFECIVNDSQIPGIPLPGTYQYDRPVTILNKEDYEQGLQEQEKIAEYNKKIKEVTKKVYTRKEDFRFEENEFEPSCVYKGHSILEARLNGHNAQYCIEDVGYNKRWSSLKDCKEYISVVLNEEDFK